MLRMKHPLYPHAGTLVSPLHACTPGSMGFNAQSPGEELGRGLRSILSQLFETTRAVTLNAALLHVSGGTSCFASLLVCLLPDRVCSLGLFVAGSCSEKSDPL